MMFLKVHSSDFQEVKFLDIKENSIGLSKI